MKLLIITLLICNVFAADEQLALKYINSLRQSTGLNKLAHNKTLDIAAQNHADYISDIYSKYSKNLMHKEDNLTYPSEYYTGESSKQRGVHIGYRSLYNFENLSGGHKNIFVSIDSLMSAIYHRFTFLKNNIDEIGIGVNKLNKRHKVYNYNMGNSLINELCKGASFGGKGKYVYNVCGNKDLRIENTLYAMTKYHFPENSPKHIIWPPKNGRNIPPVFFEEYPDPLPNISVSGYPISIEFNNFYYDDKDIVIQSFKLFDENDNEITNAMVMDYSNDPNSKHTRFQFTLFPMDRLEWNHIYKVEIVYYVDNEPKDISWRFLTKDIGYPYYKINGTKDTIKVKSDNHYALYFVPTDENDTFKSWKLLCKPKTKKQITYIDKNTILFKLTGEIGDTCSLKLSNLKKIKIQISSTDTAINQ